MTRDDVIAALTALPKFGDGVGDARMEQLTRALPATPWFGTGEAIHVTGSQGKGTVATLTAAILKAYGVRCGLYLSPHLFRFEERIVIDGTPIDEDALTDAFGALTIPAGSGAFEAITTTALAAFARARLDTVVLEAGIGGRHDSTEIAGGRLVALTGIDREHLDLLGPTERDVLYQKADLCPRGGTLIVGALRRDLADALEEHARRRGFTLRFAERESRIQTVTPTRDGMRVDLDIFGTRWADVAMRLLGVHQAGNAVLALLLVEAWLRDQDRFDGPRFERAARAAFAQTSIPLRFERVADEPEIFADVAHTPAALRALDDIVALHLGGIKPIVVFGISEGKNAREMLATVTPFASRILCSAAGHRALSPARLADACLDSQIGVEVHEDLPDALARARALALDEGRPVLVTGSLFIARDAALLLRGGEPNADASL